MVDPLPPLDRSAWQETQSLQTQKKEREQFPFFFCSASFHTVSVGISCEILWSLVIIYSIHTYII